MSEVIRTVDLSKRYRKVAALDGPNLSIPEGSVFGLVGPNGAGKTTTLKTIMNILKPDAGHAEVLGVDSRRIGPDELARIGYASENQEMPDWMTVEYLLAYLKPFYPTWDDARAAELVREFNLPLDRKLRHLSRGMRMKAALASSLAYRPRLLVLDEPFSGLDPVMREDLIEGIIESAEETTILVSSHDLAEIESFASHIAYLEGGRLRFAEEMTSLSARFREIEVTFEPPITLGKKPADIMDGIQCYAGYLNNLVCRSPFRWPARIVSQQSELGRFDLIRLISYSPFPATLNLEPMVRIGEVYLKEAPLPENRQVTVEVKQPIAFLRRDVEVRNLYLDAPQESDIK